MFNNRTCASFSFIDLFFAKRILTRLNSQEESHLVFLAALFASSRMGHLRLDLSEEGLKSIGNLFSATEVDLLERLLKEAMNNFPFEAASEWVIQSGSSYYLQNNWIYETAVLTHLERLSQELTFTVPPTRDPILNREQQEAVIKALQHSVSFLTGGPGTGKTFTAAYLVKAALASVENPERFRIVLTAPTGKAAFQLASSLKKTLITPLQIQAGTLHALLGVRSSYESELKTLFADLILVDESSMIDVRLFVRLLASIPKGSRVVFIGDKDQLPPVESGSVFADLLESGKYPSTKLQSCLRSDSSAILSLAQAMKEGDVEKSLALLSIENQWIDLDKQDPVLVLRELWNRFGGRFLHFFEEEPPSEALLSLLGRFTLLSCVRQGPLGVEEINLHFFNQSLSCADLSSWMVIPVMVTANDYELGLYNGDQGVLCCRTSSNPVLRHFCQEDYFLFSNRKISPWALSSFTLSYAVSVHKSQGSEYEEVVVLAPPGSESFGREVLYTAVTRAKKRVVVASTKALISKAIGTSSRKQSGIKEIGRGKALER